MHISKLVEVIYFKSSQPRRSHLTTCVPTHLSAFIDSALILSILILSALIHSVLICSTLIIFSFIYSVLILSALIRSVLILSVLICSVLIRSELILSALIRSVLIRSALIYNFLSRFRWLFCDVSYCLFLLNQCHSPTQVLNSGPPDECYTCITNYDFHYDTVQERTITKITEKKHNN